MTIFLRALALSRWSFKATGKRIFATKCFYVVGIADTISMCSMDTFIITCPTTGHPSLRRQPVALTEPGDESRIPTPASPPSSWESSGTFSNVSGLHCFMCKGFIFLMRLPKSLTVKGATYTLKCYKSLDVIVASCNGKEIVYS